MTVIVTVFLLYTYGALYIIFNFSAFTLYSVLYTLYSVLYALYSVLFTL